MSAETEAVDDGRISSTLTIEKEYNYNWTEKTISLLELLKEMFRRQDECGQGEEKGWINEIFK